MAGLQLLGASPVDVADLKSQVNVLNLGTDWSKGERRFAYTSDNPAAQKAKLNLGTTAEPDTTYGPAFAISRVLSVPESSFVGDGEGGLAAFRATTVAVEGSEGQAIGGAFSAVTHSSHEGEHSLADAIASTHVAIS